MARPKAVVVGAGSIAGAWFPVLAAERVAVLGVVDLNIEAARRRVKEYGVDAEVGTDVRGMLKRTRPDFVVDLTVPEAHAAVTCVALRAGCHVIGEKPMASSMTEARRMVRTAAQTGKRYMVSQSRRWDKQHEALRGAVQRDKIGAVTTLNCDFFLGRHFGGFRDEMPSPLILDMAIHHFDLARFITGVDPRAVYAHEFNPAGSWFAGDAAASCIFEMSDDVVFTYRGSWCAEGCGTSWNGNWRVVGEKGTLLYEQDAPPRGQVVAGKKGFSRPLREVKVAESKLKYAGMHGALREMLAFLRTGQQPQTECHDNIKSLAMVFAAMQSARNSRRVAIKA